MLECCNAFTVGGVRTFSLSYMAMRVVHLAMWGQSLASVTNSRRRAELHRCHVPLYAAVTLYHNY